MKRIFFVILVILLSLTLFSCAKKEIERTEKSVLNIDFTDKGMVRNGSETYTYQVENSMKGTCGITINRTSGSVSIDIYPSSDPTLSLYKGRDLDTTSFEVIFSENGEYKVQFTFKDFIGDYGINWKTE